MVRVVLLVLLLLEVTVNLAVNLSALVYVCDGFCAELVEPSPKVQCQALIGPVD